MTMLTAKQLTQLRSDVAELFPDTCVIRRVISDTPDSRGYADPSHAIAGTIVCRIDPFKKQRDNNILGSEFGSFRVANRAWFMLSTAWNSDIQDGDNVSYENKIYEVLRVFDDHSNRIARRALLVKMEGENEL